MRPAPCPQWGFSVLYSQLPSSLKLVKKGILKNSYKNCKYKLFSIISNYAYITVNCHYVQQDSNCFSKLRWLDLTRKSLRPRSHALEASLLLLALTACRVLLPLTVMHSHYSRVPLLLAGTSTGVLLLYRSLPLEHFSLLKIIQLKYSSSFRSPSKVLFLLQSPL